MASMIEPLAPDEDARLLRRLSPNGTLDDVPEVWLRRVGNTQKIQLRQTRKGDAARSIFLTLENLDEILEIGDEMPEVEQT